MPTQDFSEFRNYADNHLLAIVRDPSHYQPEAVSAAHAELRLRGVSAGDLKQSAVRTAGKKVIKRLSTQGGQFFTFINPFYLEGPERDLRMIIVSTAFFILYNLTTDFSLSYGGLYASTTNPLVWVPSALLVPVLWFFYRHRRIAWMVLLVWAGSSLAAMCFLFYQLIAARFTIGGSDMDLTTPVITLLIYGSNSYVLGRKPLRTVFGIKNWMFFSTLVIAALVFVAEYFVIFRK